MVTFAALALMAAASPSTLAHGADRVQPGVAAQEVGRCGFPHVALSYDGLVGEYIVMVPEIQDAPDAQLRCAAQVSLKTDYYISFRNPLNRRYEELYWTVAEGEGRARANEWLAKRGLLKKLPTYDRAKTDKLAFARKLEDLCGPRAKGAFALDQGTLTLKAGSAGRPRLDAETADCLMNAQWASGLPTGFAGTPYYAAH